MSELTDRIVEAAMAWKRRRDELPLGVEPLAEADMLEMAVAAHEQSRAKPLPTVLIEQLKTAPLNVPHTPGFELHEARLLGRCAHCGELIKRGQRAVYYITAKSRLMVGTRHCLPCAAEYLSGRTALDEVAVEMDGGEEG